MPVLLLSLLLLLGFADGAALAAQPEPWQLGFQPPASPVM
jgi:hypothetical protein